MSLGPSVVAGLSTDDLLERAATLLFIDGKWYARGRWSAGMQTTFSPPCRTARGSAAAPGRQRVAAGIKPVGVRPVGVRPVGVRPVATEQRSILIAVLFVDVRWMDG